MSPDRVHFVKLSDGSFEDVTEEEMEIVSDWLTRFREPIEPEEQRRVGRVSEGNGLENR